MKANIPDPNPALTAWHVGPECKTRVTERIDMAQLLFQARVAKRTGRLAASAHTHVGIEPVFGGSDRWVGHLTVGGGIVDYAAAHEFGTQEGAPTDADRYGTPETVGAEDLNFVLAELGGW